MLAAGRWIAQVRYNRRVKRLQKGFAGNDACRLVRADKNLAMNAMMDAGQSGRRTLDVCAHPFVFPSGSQTFRRYVLYNSFYCVFPPEDTSSSSTSAVVSQDQVLRDYGTWLTKCKREHDLPQGVIAALKKESRALIHPDAAAAFNRFYVTNKFVCGGYVLSVGDDGEDTTVTLIYHRTQPLQKDERVLVDPNLFCLLESLGDITTHSQVHNEWCGAAAREVSLAQYGVDTDIVSVPLDKAFYATLTCALKTSFYPRDEHVNIYPTTTQKTADIYPATTTQKTADVVE